MEFELFNKGVDSMANRSYLYAIEKESKKVIGISECNYDIPFVFKILVSSNTQMVPSKIFQNSELIALQGDFEGGKRNLFECLDRLLLTYECYKDELEKKIQKTKQFLATIKEDYFYLDCSEIYDMHDTPLEEQNKQLFDSIKNLDMEIEQFMKRLNDMMIQYQNLKNTFPRSGFFLKKRQEKATKELKEIQREIDNLLFLDYWTNTLYYEI